LERGHEQTIGWADENGASGTAVRLVEKKPINRKNVERERDREMRDGCGLAAEQSSGTLNGAMSRERAAVQTDSPAVDCACSFCSFRCEKPYIRQ
jgi:hypothetical protein